MTMGTDSFQLKINGTTIKSPLDFQINSYNLTKAGRTAAGKMKMDLIAKKRKFEFVYDVLKGADLETIMALIDTNEMFMQLSYVENGNTKTACVYVGEVSRRRFRTEGGWYWKDVKFNLIEQ